MGIATFLETNPHHRFKDIQFKDIQFKDIQFKDLVKLQEKHGVKHIGNFQNRTGGKTHVDQEFVNVLTNPNFEP